MRVRVRVYGRVGLSKRVLLGGVAEAAGVGDKGGVVHFLRVMILVLCGAVMVMMAVMVVMVTVGGLDGL